MHDVLKLLLFNYICSVNGSYCSELNALIIIICFFRSPPLITITEATPEWLARDVDRFDEHFMDTGGYDVLAESPPRSIEEVLYRSPTPERLPSPAPAVEFDFLPDDELFAQQFPERLDDIDLFGESPPGAVGGYEPCQPCQRDVFDPEYEAIIAQPGKYISVFIFKTCIKY